MLIFRCVNGVVGWLIRQTAPDQVALTCVNDQTVVVMPRSADSSWPTHLLAIAQHTISLSGAIQETIVLPRVL